MTRTTTGLAAVLLAGALLTACSSGDEPDAGTTSAPSSASSAADSPSASPTAAKAAPVPDDRACYAYGYDAAVAPVARGTSVYQDHPDGPVTRTFDNCFLIRFDGDGRCAEFTELYMERPR